MRVGIDVARYLHGATALDFVSEFKEGDFDHAVDNFGDSVGLVADWLALARWWRPNPPASRCRRGYIDYQLGNRPASGLDRRIFPRRRKLLKSRNESLLRVLTHPEDGFFFA